MVDDDTQLVDNLSRILTRLGYSVHEYTKGEDMVNEYHQVTPDLVIIDLVLKKDSPNYRSGLEILYKLCKLNNPPGIILISGFEMSPSQIQLWQFIQLTYKRVKFLPKPFGYEELYKMLSRLDTNEMGFNTYRVPQLY